MAHGRSTFTGKSVRRRFAVAAGLVFFLSLTGASGPVDVVTPIRLFSTDPLTHKPEPADAPVAADDAIPLSAEEVVGPAPTMKSSRRIGVSPVSDGAPMIARDTGEMPVLRKDLQLDVDPAQDATVAPQQQPVELLHDLPPAAMIAPATAEKGQRVLSMTVTAYCACKKCCGSHARGLTASGKPTTYNNGHFIAADTKILPYGTKVIVPGYNDGKPVAVIDRGGAIRGYHIDVFMATHEQAVQWGKKRLVVTIQE